MPKCYYILFRKFIIQLLNSGLKMPEKLLESCIFLAMLSSTTNLLNVNVLIKKGDQQHVFSIQLKLNMSEMKKKVRTGNSI